MMNQGRGLAELVMSAAHLPDGVRLVMVGDGPLRAALLRMVHNAGLQENVLMPGAVPQVELHHWTASADLGVLILEPINLSKRLALANKIFEYMSAGIPILATDLPENRRILASCECGWLTEQWGPTVLAGYLSRILADQDEMRRRAENGRRCFEQRYNWERESRHLIAHLDGVVPRDSGASL
jgi:glycosyltransferase involved in cell wall biosynthesis